MRILNLGAERLENVYIKVAEGSEGIVYRYNSSSVLKVFKKELFHNQTINKDIKFKKIEELIKIKNDINESFNFPSEIVCAKGTKIGYLSNYIENNNRVMDIFSLFKTKETKRFLEILIKVNSALSQIHKQGFIVGDIKGSNILINKDGNPIFIDADNFAFGQFDFDIIPGVTRMFRQFYGKECSRLDNDKFLLALLFLSYFDINGKKVDEKYINNIVKSLKLDKESNEILNCIFSDSIDKPYIEPVLVKMLQRY